LQIFFGEDNIENIHLPFDKEKEQLRGFGYVTFFKLEGLKQGLKLNSKELKKETN